MIMTIAASVIAGAASGVVAWACATTVAEVRWESARGRGRWSPESATRDEERLARRLSMNWPRDVLAHPEDYAVWRARLVVRAGERLFEDLRLRREGLFEEVVLVLRELSVGERRLVLAGVAQHLFQTLFGKFGQQVPQQCAEHQGLGRGDGAAVNRFDHGSSLGLQPGCAPETAAGATPSPSKGGDA